MCLDTPREMTILAPCGHRVLCLLCTLEMFAGAGGGQPLCPLCRCPAASYVVRVYDS